MRVNILPVLSGALLLSACGSSVVGGSSAVGEDLPACEMPSNLADFNPPEPLTGLEVRTFFTGVGEGESNPVVRTLGESCSSTTCAAEVEQLDSQQKGWEFVAAGERSIPYVIGINEGSLVGSATSDAELLAL